MELPHIKRIPGWLKGLLKFIFTLSCLWYLTNQIEWKKLVPIIQQSAFLWFFPALCFFVCSKWIAAIRLQCYFDNINLHLSHNNNVKLYWLGMFYNLFLPGGIGGDAYKIIVLHRRKGVSVKLLTSAMLLDRVSGLAALLSLAALFFFLIFQPLGVAYLVLLTIIPGLIVFYLAVNKIFPSFKNSFFSTLWLGFVVQIAQVGCLYFLLQSMHVGANLYVYILLFLISSVVAIIPFTIGGLGARELLFLWGSRFFLLNDETSVAVSLLFYITTLLVSMVGATWLFRDPLPESPDGA
jgi:uncharacterized membrane protein YbhN (UPF0104 family)